MATSALKTEPVPTFVKRERVTFCKRQKGAKLWNRFYSTLLITRLDGDRLVEDLRASHPALDFQMEVERA